MSMSYANMIENRHLKVSIVSIFLKPQLRSDSDRIEIADTNHYRRKRSSLPSPSRPSSHAFLRPILYIRRSKTARSGKNWTRKEKLLGKFKSRRETDLTNNSIS